MQSYFLTLPEAELDFPIGPDVLVFKVVKNVQHAELVSSAGRINPKLDPDPGRALPRGWRCQLGDLSWARQRKLIARH